MPNGQALERLFRRIFGFGALTALCGVPIVAWFWALTLFGACLALALFPIRNGFRAWMISFAILGTTLVVKSTCQLPQIEEGHNFFVTEGRADEVLRRKLPPEVFGFMAAAFERAYPKANSCSAEQYGCWRYFGAPKETFAFNTESVFSPSMESRFTSSIAFHNAYDLRSGFVNMYEPTVMNWYPSVSEIPRESMPYFVKFTWPERISGDELCWKGDVLWERGSTFDVQKHDTFSCQRLEKSDIGKSVFGISIDQSRPLSMELIPTLPERITIYLRSLLTIFAIVVFVFANTKPTRRHFAAFIGCIGICLLFAPWAQLEHFASTYPFGGGGDGLTYDSYGRAMVRYIVQGHWLKALKGVERVYYFMPGLRYFRMIEKIVFGETSLGYFLVMIACAAVLFSLVRKFFGPIFTFVLLMVAAFPVVHWINGAFAWDLPYLARLAAVGGFAEPLGYTLFLGALACLMRCDRYAMASRYAVGAGILLALAVFVRPNLAIATSFALIMTTCQCLRSRYFWPWIWLCVGFLPILGIPLHNWIFGHKFILLTSAATISANYHVHPSEYVRALMGILHGEGLGAISLSMRDELKGWTAGFPVLRVAALLLSLVPLVFRGHFTWRHRYLSVVVLGLQAPLFTYVNADRYAVLAWMLTGLAALSAIKPALGSFMRFLGSSVGAVMVSAARSTRCYDPLMQVTVYLNKKLGFVRAKLQALEESLDISEV